MPSSETRNTVAHVIELNDDSEWTEYSGTAFRCAVYLSREEDGYSVVAANLLGVASQGDSEAEALANITEALAAAILTYKEDGGSIPWTEKPREPEPDAITRWVFVHV